LEGENQRGKGGVPTSHWELTKGTTNRPHKTAKGRKHSQPVADFKWKRRASPKADGHEGRKKQRHKGHIHGKTQKQLRTETTLENGKTGGQPKSTPPEESKADKNSKKWAGSKKSKPLTQGEMGRNTRRVQDQTLVQADSRGFAQVKEVFFRVKFPNHA